MDNNNPSDSNQGGGMPADPAVPATEAPAAEMPSEAPASEGSEMPAEAPAEQGGEAGGDQNPSGGDTSAV